MAKKTNLKRSLVIAVFLVATACRVAAGDVIYVDDDASIGGNGQSWGTAYKYLQDALADVDSSTKPVEIWVAEGTYKPDQGGGQTPGDRTATFQLTNGLAVYGGFPSGGGAWSDRDCDAYETILSGDLADNDTNDFGNYSDNSYRVLTARYTDANSILDGFTIKSGFGSVSGRNGWGAGLYIYYNCRLTVKNCTFTKNKAKEHGGGICADSNSTLELIDCHFKDNRSYNYGGAITLDANPHTLIENCTFELNHASYRCGALEIGASNVTIENCTFIQNKTDIGGSSVYNYGGAIYAASTCSPIIRNCRFYDNSSKFGGAINYNVGVSGTISDCIFIGNQALSGVSGGGAIMLGNSSSPMILNCKFMDNLGSSYGGGISSQSYSKPTVANCLFSANNAGYEGGGFHMNDSSPTITNCTFTKNYGRSTGGLMILFRSPSVRNCIFWENSNSSGSDNEQAQIYPRFTSFQAYSCCIQDADANDASIPFGGATNGNIDDNPLFVDPNGPDGTAGTADDNLHLSPGSPCIDAGDPGGDYIGQTDIDGDPRVSDGRVDMGSDEVIWGGAENISPGQSVTLNPGGGPNDPNEEALVVFDNNSVKAANITVVEMSSNPHPPAPGFEALGTTLTIDTSLADGEFKMTVVIPFDANDLDDLAPLSVNLMYYDTSSGGWVLAVAVNTQPQPDPVGTRWLEVAPTDPAPTLQALNSRPLGDYGLFWNPSTAKGFVWANIDHSTDLSAAARGLPDFEPDGDVDAVDLAFLALRWLDAGCGACDGFDLTGEGNIDFSDLKVLVDNWLAGK